ncbi:DUF4340 domain-containing protein [Leptolyngbya sp. FACHB-541]|uniref:DUF4340 domain-containing protein n=1 Tax=Leptolyngbya sp. FACHB-541 TaxID=2692810 RepID=UPI001681ECFB|nr:DUF4340 domain-containing protein [Leptolyngbya sp. FACHB-541]MBD1995717.1 DUF4340 domain-containing protein [Leptolyngbya sp. FACHB-541]
MKFKPTTLALVAIAAILGGVVYFTETRNSSDPEATEGADGSIFEFEEDQVQSFTVETPERTLSFEKDDAGQWQMQQPESGLASDASVAYLLNLLATGESDIILTVPATDAAEFGLDEPTATINVVLDNQETHQLILGSANFDNSAIYAQADPEADSEPEPATEEGNSEQTADAPEISVLQVSPDFENAVNRPLEEWRSQPDEPPPTNSPSPSTAPPDTSGSGAAEPEASPPAANPPAANPPESSEPEASAPAVSPPAAESTQPAEGN